MNGIQRSGKSFSVFLFVLLVLGNPASLVIADEHEPGGVAPELPVWAITSPKMNSDHSKTQATLMVSGTAPANTTVKVWIGAVNAGGTFEELTTTSDMQGI